MVDYWTGFSIELPVGAGNIEAALAIYAQFRDELDAGHQPIGFRAEKIEPNNGTVWLWDGGDGDVEHVIDYAFRCARALNLTGLWGFRFSLYSSRPVLDGFGGGAQVLDLGRRESVDWVDLERWLATQLGKGETRTISAETVLQPVSDAQGWNRDSQVSVLLGFVDSLIAADAGVADRLRIHLTEVSAPSEDLVCRECGEPMRISDAGVSHHVGDGPEEIDYSRDRDHTAVADEEP